MIKIKAYGICLYKVKKDTIKILLCKATSSKEKWGFLKGVKENKESKKQTAQREFFEESSIKIPLKYFAQYFEQLNDEKDIGIYLVNANNIHEMHNIGSFFINDILESKHLSWENQEVKFFNIEQLPPIKKKQSKLIIEVIDFLRSKNLSR